jgi:hypothetical protein
LQILLLPVAIPQSTIISLLGLRKPTKTLWRAGLLVLNSNHLQLGRRDYLNFSKIGLEKTEM